MSFRNNISRTVEALINKEELEKAEELLDVSLEKMPVDGFLHYGMLLGYPDAYYKLKKTDKARKVSLDLIRKFEQNLEYYSQFEEVSLGAVFDNIENNLLMYDQIVKTTVRYDTDEFGDSIKDRYIKQLELFSSLLEE